MNLAVAISRRDKVLALLWAKWLAAVGVSEGTTIFLTFDQKVDNDTLSRVHHVLKEIAEVDLEMYFGEDPGYPGGANRMFIFTARRAARAGKPFLWMETDMTPMRPGWMERVKAEYYRKNKPFMGPVLHMYDTPHVNGTAVYPPDWEELSDIAEAPDHWPWDTFSRRTVYPQAASSETLKHTYGNKTFPRDSGVLDETVEVFHPCKDTTLIEVLNKDLGLLPADAFRVDPCYITIEGYTPALGRIQTKRINMPGVDWRIAKLETLKDQTLAFREIKFTEITETEYHNLINQ